MPRILIRSHKAPFTVADAETTYDKNLIGNNTGNLVFSQSVYRLLSTADAELSTSGLAKSKAKSINGSYDHVVIPLANAFRPGYEPTLDALSTLIEELTVPVTWSASGRRRRSRATTRTSRASGPRPAGSSGRCSTAHPRSASAVSSPREFLAELGFGDEHVRVIGCPSMFMYGPDFAVHKKVDALTQHSPIALNISPYVREMGPISLYGAEHYPNLLYMAQNIQTLELMLHGTYPMGKKGTMLRTGVPVTLEHPLIRQNRVRSSWTRRPGSPTWRTTTSPSAPGSTATSPPCWPARRHCCSRTTPAPWNWRTTTRSRTGRSAACRLTPTRQRSTPTVTGNR